MNNILEEIETQYPVNEIRTGGQQLWPLLRRYYYLQHNSTQQPNNNERTSYGRSFISWIISLYEIFYGAKNWFRKYDYVVLGSSNTRRIVNGKHFNIFIDGIMDEVGQDKSLFIEDPAPHHFSRRNTYSKNIVSSFGITLAASICQYIISRTTHNETNQTLKNINERYGIKAPPTKIFENYKIKHWLYTKIFKRIKPRFIFLTCFYGREAAIKAAHDLNICVIEIQHGVIGKAHPSYNIFTKLDKSYFPDYLLVYGKKELSTFAGSNFIDQSHVFPIGSYYIDHINNNYKTDEDVFERLKLYEYKAGVTLQLGVENSLIEFITYTAKLDPHICYILIPRRDDDYIKNYTFPENVLYFKQHNFYELMRYVDFHSTIYSSCAIEAPSLGVQNILLNINNYSIKYLGMILNDDRITRFVETPEEYVQTIRTLPKLAKNMIRQLNNDNILDNYKHNLHSVLKLLGFFKD